MILDKKKTSVPSEQGFFSDKFRASRANEWVRASEASLTAV